MPEKRTAKVLDGLFTSILSGQPLGAAREWVPIGPLLQNCAFFVIR